MTQGFAKKPNVTNNFNPTIYTGMTGWNVADYTNSAQFSVTNNANVAFYGQGLASVSFSNPYVYINVSDAPSDGSYYARLNGSWSAVSSGTGMLWRGAFVYSTYYNANDAVSYNGSSYIAVNANSYDYPDSGSGNWNMLAQKGADGTNGMDGSNGSNGADGKYTSVQSPLYEVSGSQIGIYQSSSGQDGYLSATDWNTFNNKLSSVDATTVPYSPGNTSNWNSTPPSTVQDALDRIAAVLTANSLQP